MNTVLISGGSRGIGAAAVRLFSKNGWRVIFLYRNSERAAAEITNGMGRQTVPEGVAVFNPAFDVTPAALIAAIVCERGIARPDYRESLRRLATSTAPR